MRVFNEDILSSILKTTYTILTKDGHYLALPEGDVLFRNFSSQALFDQGYIVVHNLQAENPNTAVQKYNALYNNEINKLKQEIIKLKGEISELSIENKELKENAGDNTSDSIKLFKLFGFNDTPNPKELKERYKRIQQMVHSDKGGGS